MLKPLKPEQTDALKALVGGNHVQANFCQPALERALSTNIIIFLCASFLELSGVLTSLLGERGDWYFFNLPNGLQKKEGTAHSLDFSMQYQLFLSILVEAKFFKQISLKLGVGVGRGGEGEGIVVDSLLVNNFLYI